MDVGKIIKAKRTARNLTQAELATEFFVSRQLISKWENGKSYPDLEQLVKLSDFFSISLDELMRGDKKMTAKLNFDRKKKQLLWVVSICLIIIVANYFVSRLPLPVKTHNLAVLSVEMMRDEKYNGGNPERDWNTIMIVEIQSKNPFLQPDATSFLTTKGNQQISGHLQMSFSLFNSLNFKKATVVTQSMLIDQATPLSELTFAFDGSADKIIPNVLD